MASQESLIDRLSHDMQTGALPFPHYRLFNKAKVEQLYRQLSTYQPIITIGTDKLRIKQLSNIITYNNYKLIKSDHCFWRMDVLSDYFNNIVRCKGTRVNEKHSPYNTWSDPEVSRLLATEIVWHPILGKHIDNIITDYQLITDDDLFIMREILYFNTRGPSIFKPSWIIGILSCFWNADNMGSKKWLDISAGYGDRLLVACKYNCIYKGFDPNYTLKSGLNQIIDQFGDHQRQQVEMIPFEDSVLDSNTYDFVLSSPPFFILEKYTDQDTQSIQRYSKFPQWMVQFLFTSLDKAWRALKEDGYLIIHMDDSKFYSICEPMNLFIKQRLPGSQWVEMIGIGGKTPRITPIWVWKKTNPLMVQQKYNKNAGKYSLCRLYPDIGEQLIVNDCQKILSTILSSSIPTVSSRNYQLDLSNINQTVFNLIYSLTTNLNQVKDLFFKRYILNSIFNQLRKDHSPEVCFEICKQVVVEYSTWWNL